MNDEVQKRKYINIIRRTVTLNAFIQQYFIRIIVIYLLMKGVTPWVAVSIPVVLEAARLFSRSIKGILEIALKMDYKKNYYFSIITSIALCLILSQCRDVYTIYLFTIIFGFITGINNSSITRLCTSNNDYESHFLFEQERAFTIGATAGLIISQLVYDFSPTLYVIGFIIAGVLSVALNLNMEKINLNDNDDMKSLNDSNKLQIKEKKDVVLITLLYSALVGLWCMGINGLDELTPLITTQTGYLNAIYTGVELIALFIISGSILAKIKKSNKLLLGETIIALLDVSYLLLAAILPDLKYLIIIYFFCGMSSVLGDPIWGSIISKYSMNSRVKYVLVNKIFFFMRGIFAVLSIFICRMCVISGINSFIIFSIALLFGIVLMYLITNNVNKKVFGTAV